MGRKFAAVLCSTLLLSPGWLGGTGFTSCSDWCRCSGSAIRTTLPAARGGKFRLGAPHLRTLECFYDLVDLAGHSRRPFRRDDRLVFPEHGRLHALPYGFEKGTEGIGLHAARFRLDRHGVLVHDRRLLLALAAAGQRILARCGPCNGTNTRASSAVRSGCFSRISCFTRPGAVGATQKPGPGPERSYSFRFSFRWAFSGVTKHLTKARSRYP